MLGDGRYHVDIDEARPLSVLEQNLQKVHATGPKSAQRHAGERRATLRVGIPRPQQPRGSPVWELQSITTATRASTRRAEIVETRGSIRAVAVAAVYACGRLWAGRCDGVCFVFLWMGKKVSVIGAEAGGGFGCSHLCMTHDPLREWRWAGCAAPKPPRFVATPIAPSAHHSFGTQTPARLNA